MKTLITLFFGLTISGLIYSQSYYPIVQENNEWNVLQVIYPGTGNPWDTIYWTQTYKLTGDTIISEQTYKKVYLSEEEITTNWEYEGGIREEEEKVWYFSKYGNGETILYDFTIEVGDTITYLPQPFVVDSINYREINGEDRKHFYLSYLEIPYTEFWIEGIGSNYGILSSGGGMGIGGWTWFLCMSENGELIYMNPNYNSCHLISTGIEEMNNSIIQVYPNPTHDKIKIKNTENIKIESISIIDLKGKKIIEFGKNQTDLDLSGISTGIYLLKLTHENGEVIRKIMIE
jgi:hypothetical protein